ncbi:TetR/AcrR family transcriptional regulator [Streptomyces hygroscopicus]|uniref:TetR/AcrR family transcriptional regulator n=1 Tax=Streptomyces hygroscopicus TaxID=1912 RepID=UPI00076760CE|nr:TetR/AcrR family transcriptional regulator [Streptomyces hygroscopicus]GLV78136.1 TetR family transcriptional regulator [Streptomyces hygroscopicus subsp. hygroscopicus]
MATQSPETAAPQRRSKITPEREQEFYRAVLDLLQEGGYEALTIEAVAARTRSSRSTLYRQWNTKPQLVVAALRSCNRRFALEGIDTGSLVGDLRAVAEAAGEACGGDTALVYALGHAALQNPDLLQALRAALIEHEVKAIQAMVRRGVERGEVATDNPAVEFVPTQLIGAMRVRPLLESKLADREYLTRFLEASVFPALGLAP